MTGNEQDAEDVVQESFLRAWRRLDEFESRAAFGTWVYRIAANCALDTLRARQRQGERQEEIGQAGTDPLLSVPSPDPLPDRLAESGQTGDRMRAAMDMLSDTERAAFVMRHFEERSIEEIGRTLGVKQNAAKQSIFRAVRKLRRALEPLASPLR
jgi:RNA polymerase sigma-70 factor (ECF subfamily)